MPVDASQARAFAKSIRTVSPQLAGIAAKAVIKTVADTKRDAQTLAPVDTGNLRSSIVGTTKRLAGGTVGEVGPTAEYGIYQELGTSTQPGKPYLFPAFDRNAPLFEKAMEQIAKML